MELVPGGGLADDQDQRLEHARQLVRSALGHLPGWRSARPLRDARTGGWTAVAFDASHLAVGVLKEVLEGKGDSPETALRELAARLEERSASGSSGA
jgi:hypothetical protein